MEDRDRLGQRDRQVEEQRALPRLLDGLEAQVAAAFGGRVRLGGQQPGVEVGGFAGVGRGPAELSAVGGLPLAEQQVIGFAIYLLAGFEAEGLSARAPPVAGGSPPLSLAWM